MASRTWGCEFEPSDWSWGTFQYMYYSLNNGLQNLGLWLSTQWLTHFSVLLFRPLLTLLYLLPSQYGSLEPPARHVCPVQPSLISSCQACPMSAIFFTELSMMIEKHQCLIASLTWSPLALWLLSCQTRSALCPMDLLWKKIKWKFNSGREIRRTNPSAILNCIHTSSSNGNL